MFKARPTIDLQGGMQVAWSNDGPQSAPHPDIFVCLTAAFCFQVHCLAKIMPLMTHMLALTRHIAMEQRSKTRLERLKTSSFRQDGYFLQSVAN